MKRDMGLVRELLLALENAAGEVKHSSLNVPGYDEGTIKGHIDLMIDRGLVIDHSKPLAIGRNGPMPFWSGGVALSWAGHDFLDALRNEPSS